MSTLTDTSYTKPKEKFEKSNSNFEYSINIIDSVSDLVDIDFPKARILHFSNNKTNFEISVDYNRLSKQLKSFSSNK